MNKHQVFDALRQKLETELNTAVGASKDAADYATNEESRAESKYDTQGLEASYLAAGQASIANTLVDALSTLNSLEDEMTAPRDRVMRGALFECDLGGMKEWFYMAPVGGGETLELDGVEISILTAKSPLGQSIAGKSTSASFRLPNGLDGRIVQVL
tara:strand:+ start:39643 stop:40113 length:471 start_codon:yes stop_codon:yes gene_type:complete